ncbi:hypothetical protein AX774_g2932 [Zancudomyces culisetae]|uniref:Uncharacterized protein n=1 Tax=Zancudomyces culisetae TaxID=1213189 RepID=A0A1R1PRE8_ZANCU|nr:hypothetical protein AX774_g2932 [Zancudomyces culisetae]|eukprot:OMH83560.1 hypothetical protein AX774_g2932 [Zancudomyces culisetae]
MDQKTGVLSPRTLGELTESVRQLQIRRSPEPMSVSSISPTLYRGNNSPEHPIMHITLRGSDASSSSGHTRTDAFRQFPKGSRTECPDILVHATAPGTVGGG